MKLHALVLLSLLLGGATGQAQNVPAPTTTPLQGEPLIPVPSTPAAEEPAASPGGAADQGAPLLSPAPAAPTPPPVPMAPLSIVLREQIPTALNGVKVYEPHVQALQLPAERTAILRAQGKLTVSLREDVLRFARRVSREAQDARFESRLTDAGSWRLVLRPGIQVDVEATLAAVEAALRDPTITRVDVVYTSSLPQRTLDFFLRRGITTLIGEGITSYAGSSRARTENIHVGTRRFQDVLFDAKVFSFNQQVGPITAANGYLPGLVIAGERTASGVGGGICQVSTTVFRTLFSAGLPIVERRNHSYQVRYYDPQGLDATIYQPTQDLKFANDTGSAIWFQASWDDDLGRLEIQAFGRPRAETVRVEVPRLLATRPSPAAKLIPDASLAPGQRVQVDWAAAGATIEVDRVFLRGDEVVRRETLRSVYRPWPDIFLVGPS